ncbi:membrane protein [Pandoraea communis]|uniref:Membrane protein n=1 Tax=Pandoraea communis TaxID=2508297 RepID=A0A5E4TUW7_9BURK|nr:YoaK family protein [Pandoraea communis]VVD91670.1 membrane protein [Pandoraea communis]
MPINYLRGFTQPVRTEAANRRLGCSLAFVAGAANAGGFLAVGMYTSHMSGIVAALSDNLALGQLVLVLSGLSALMSFLLGAVTSTVLVHWGRRHHTHSEYAAPLMFEAVLLLTFGAMGANLEHHRVLYVPATVSLLCYVMGLQNAIITKISRAEIRTTHVTGLVTDIGIELGKLGYWNRPGVARELPRVMGDRQKLRLLCSLLGMFFLGGLAGALGFKYLGFSATIPLALVLVTLAIVPLLDDIARRHPH